MNSYDTDSDSESASYLATNVTIGYASKEPTGDDVSLLGGHPTWIDDKTPPPGELAKCGVCKDLLSLLIQVNGAVPENFPSHDRRLYLFSCRRKSCRRKDGTVRGIRANRVTASAEAPASTPQDTAKKDPQVDLGAQLFGAKPLANSPAVNPFAAPSTSSPPRPFSSGSSNNPFSSTSALMAKSAQKPQVAALPETYMANLRLSSPDPTTPARPHDPWPAESEFPTPFPRSHLEAEYEELTKPELAVPQGVRVDSDVYDGESTATSAVGAASGNGSRKAERKKDRDKDNEGGKGADAEDKTVFESSMDTAFQRFADRVAQNPDQVLRYEFGGLPLLYSALDDVGRRLYVEHGTPPKAAGAGHGHGAGFPPCQSCGAGRVFELQLMPQAISALEGDGPGLDGMDWGTIILGVCGRDCVPPGTRHGEVGYVEEWVGVQWEELQTYI